MDKVVFSGVAVAVSVFFCSLILILRSFAPKHTKRPPPSPLALPVIGHLYLIKNALHHSLASLSAKYGPVLLLRFGCRSILVVSSPSAVEECFTRNDIAFANRPRTMAGDRLTYNYTAFVWAPYGQLWRLQRRFATVQLFSAASLHRSSAIREGEALTVVRALCRLCETAGRAAVDLKSLAATLTFNSMMRLVAGKRCVEEEEVGRAKGNEIVKGLRGIFFASLSVMSTCDFFPVLRFLGYRGMEKKLVFFHKRRDEFLSGMLDEFRRKKTKFSDSDGDHGGDNKSMIQTLLSLQESEPEFYTDDLIKSTILIQRAEFAMEQWKYFLHYPGWNKSWDEWLGPEQLLKFTNENMQMLQEVCKKVDMNMNEMAQCGPHTRPKISRGPHGKKRKSNDVQKDKGVLPSEKLFLIPIPHQLKKQLVDDCELIMHLGKLVLLPRSPTVDGLLSQYSDYRLQKDGMISDSLREILSGLQRYFDKALYALLLYKNEREQYQKVNKDGVYPSFVYGAEHLLRLFVKLPEMLRHANIEEETVAVLRQELQDFLRFLLKNQSSFFSATYVDAKGSSAC